MKTIQSAAFRPIGMIGKAEAEEAANEEHDLIRPTPDTELDGRKLTFAYLDERPKQKKIKEKLECLRQAGETTRAEMAANA